MATKTMAKAEKGTAKGPLARSGTKASKPGALNTAGRATKGAAKLAGAKATKASAATTTPRRGRPKAS